MLFSPIVAKLWNYNFGTKVVWNIEISAVIVNKFQ